MSHTPKVSILVPIFNVEKYLEECLDSIINQTLKNIEIICIDDGSTDSSPQIIKRYAENDSRFVVITKKNSGYGDSMNKGIAKASGEYIGIVESDDFIDRDMFSDLYKLAQKHDAEIVKSNYYNYFTHLDKQSPQWNEEMGAVYSTEQGRVVKQNNTKYNIVGNNDLRVLVDPRKDQHIFYQKPAIWSAIYKKDFLESNDIRFLPTEGASYQDTGFSFKVWACARRAVFTDTAYLHYRQDNEASSVHNPGKVFCVADEYKEIEKYLKKNGLYDELGPLMQKTKYGAYSWNFKRLADGLDEGFLEHFSSEYKKADQDGILDFFFFSLSERRDLREIIEKPNVFLARKKAQANAIISIIVPVYNSESHLEECINSLAKQSLKDIEILCINDGSTDNSGEILDKLCEVDPRIRVIHQSNKGPAAARNRAMSHASGKYLMFCDSDDTYDEYMCEKMHDAIVNSDADMAVCGIKVTYTSDTTRRYQNSDKEYYRLKYRGLVETTDAVIKRTDVSPCNKIFKTSVQRGKDIWFPRGMWYEDAKFFNDYAVSIKTIYFLDNKERLYHYIRRDDGIMSSTAKKSKKTIDHIRVVMESFRFMKSHGVLSERKDLFVYNFKQYYALSKRSIPDSSLNELNIIAAAFLRKNKPYLDSVDSSIYVELYSLLPSNMQSIRLKERVKKVLRDPVHKVMLIISPTYRKQIVIISTLNETRKQIELLDSRSSRQLSSIEESLSQLNKTPTK